MSRKRSKKYNPNKPALNPVRKFQLFGEAIEENRTIDIWQYSNGKSEADAPDLDLVLKMTKGNLVIAMRQNLIEKEQSFHFACEVHAEHEDGRKVFLEYEYAVPQPMTYSQFLCGADVEAGEDHIYMVESGVKTRFPGVNKLMTDYFMEHTDPGFTIVKQPYVVTCFSALRNLECQRLFKSTQLMTLGCGLGVAA
ncbi:hypothetical protein [Acinetobacter chinensis]|uniref:hypothetical protein n=1 Tax=Acinetobacter chinensis TaxID=2004650 RepID=UPI0029344E4C|nr:hypothetical protein [Acinetobacter chinensis]WOE40090.1 hypothetical protein QSG87_09205 [Acinetobacter chinensis]